MILQNIIWEKYLLILQFVLNVESAKMNVPMKLYDLTQNLYSIWTDVTDAGRVLITAQIKQYTLGQLVVKGTIQNL